MDCIRKSPVNDSVPCIKDAKELLNIKRLTLLARLSNTSYFHRFAEVGMV